MGRRHRKMIQKRLITKVILFYNGNAGALWMKEMLFPTDQVRIRAHCRMVMVEKHILIPQP